MFFGADAQTRLAVCLIKSKQQEKIIFWNVYQKFSSSLLELYIIMQASFFSVLS
jgi:hypothetical protein